MKSLAKSDNNVQDTSKLKIKNQTYTTYISNLLYLSQLNTFDIFLYY